MATMQKPDIILPVADMNSLIINSNPDSSPESSVDENLTAKIENATITHRVVPSIQTRPRKRVNLSGTRKVSFDVDVNDNTINEQDENNENQKTDYKVSAKGSASSQRKRFSRRSFSTDGWVELEVKDSQHHQRFVVQSLLIMYARSFIYSLLTSIFSII